MTQIIGKERDCSHYKKDKKMTLCEIKYSPQKRKE